MAYKVLDVDYDQLKSLAYDMNEAGTRTRELWAQIMTDIEELGEGPKPWKGPNHDAFVQYFESNMHVGWYMAGSWEQYSSRTSWLCLQGGWAGRCLEVYQLLEARIEEELKAKLK